MKVEKEWLYPDSMDVAQSAPDSHIVLLENEEVRVIKVIIQPGRKEPMHTHKWPSIIVVDKPARIIYYDEGGKGREISRDENAELPVVEWMEPEKPHSVENIDNKLYHAIRIELKERHVDKSN